MSSNNSNINSSSEQLSPKDQALFWFIKLQSGEVNLEAQKNFEDWLGSNFSNRKEYEELCELWSDLDSVSNTEDRIPISLSQTSTNGVSSNKLSKFLAAAIVIFVLGVGFWNQLDILTYLTSDYQTSKGQQKNIQLSDGTKVFMNTNTALSIEYNSDSRVVRILKGQALFRPVHSSTRPFMVVTQNITVKALGTVFEVYKNKSRLVSVELYEGRLAVTEKDSKTLKLKAGEKILYRPGSGLSEIKTISAKLDQAWQRGKLIFSDLPLTQVIDEISRYKQGKIIILDDRLKNLKVSGVFDLRHPEKILETIEKTLAVVQYNISDYLTLLAYKKG